MKRSDYRVYKHTCLAPGNSFGKVYIGITCQKPHNRWGLVGQKYGHCRYFDNAIKKYGWENFSHEILASGLTRSEATRLERKYIRQYHANDSKFGFNLTPGGDNLCGGDNPHSKPVVVFDAESGIRLYDFCSGAEANEALNIIADSTLSGHCKTSCGYIVKYLDDVGGLPILPEEERFRPRAQPQKEKPINQYDLNGVYIATHKSTKEAASTTGISRDTIGNAVRLVSKSAGGFQWRFDTGDKSNIGVYVPPQAVRKIRGGYEGRFVDQIDLNSVEIIKTFPSIREAARETNIARTSIVNVMKHQRGKKAAGGYGWRFHEE